MTHDEFITRDIPFTPRVDECLRGHVYNESNSSYTVKDDGAVTRNCLPCRRLYKTWAQDVIDAAQAAKLEGQRQLTRV